MTIKKIIENSKEYYRSDLRRSVKPFFKGDRAKFRSFRSGIETCLRITHSDVILEFCTEFSVLWVTINGVNARRSTLLDKCVRRKLIELLDSKDLKESERNRLVAELIATNLPND